jgi:flagellar motor switch protein FliM
MANGKSEPPSGEPQGSPAQSGRPPGQPDPGDASPPRSGADDPLSGFGQAAGQPDRQPARTPRSPAPEPAFNSGGGLPGGSGAGQDATLSEVLSQSEIEAMLSQVQAEQVTATILKPGGHRTRLKGEEIQPCDFRQPAFLSSGQLRRIRLRHEEFIRSLAAHLSIYLRLEVVIQMSKLQTLTFQKFADSLPNPTHLAQFKVEPLTGVCLLDMAPRLGLTFVDRLLGGPAHSVSPDSELSDIEAALLDQVAILLLNEWCALWQGMEAHPVILGHESNGRFLASSAQDTVMLILSMEVRVGDCVEQMQLAFPYMTIEPLVRNLAQGADAQDGANPRGPLKWNPGYDEVPIQLRAQWLGLELTAGQLSTLKSGDVLLLDAGCFDRVELCFEQLTKFYGRLGTSGESWAVELTEPART